MATKRIKPENAYTLIDLTNMIYDGDTYAYQTIKKIITRYAVPIAANGNKNANLYDKSLVEAAVRQYKIDTGAKPKAQNASLYALKEQKTREEIDRLKQEKERAELEIKKLKQDLVDVSVVNDFLKWRFGIEAAVLKQIIIMECADKMPAMERPDARVLAERLYNKGQVIMSETLKLWQDTYNCETNEDTDKLINYIIGKINESISIPEIK